jgi:beta-phosphoglucomutase-like phosphatase (HAD superfamily)
MAGKFRNLKLLQAVASSAPSENVDFLLNENGIQEFFSAIVNADGLPSKPDPAIFLKAASLLDVEPQRCVVIEDAISGIQAALSANMKCIAVANSLPMEELGMANLILPQLNALTEEAFFNLYRN